MSQQINLYNAEFARKRDFTSLSGVATAWGLALLIAVAAVFTAMARVDSVKRELQLESHARGVAQAQMTSLASQLSARRPDADLAAELARLKAGFASRNEVMRTLHAGVIGDIHGFSGHFEAFARQTLKGLWLTRLKVSTAGPEVVLEGRATEPELVPGYVKRLNQEDVMQGHAFSQLEMRRPDSGSGNTQRRQSKYIDFRLSTLPGAVDAESWGDR